MRACWFSLTMLGCVGGANLGVERGSPALDGGPQELDAAETAAQDSAEGGRLSVRIASSELSDLCDTCFQLTVQTSAAAGSYALGWDDGSTGMSRRVCPGGAVTSYRVTLRDSATGESSSASLPLAPRSSSCPSDAGRDAGPVEALLCLRNGSFEPVASPLPGLPTNFDAAPWQACGGTANLPQVLDDQMSALVPRAPDGHTYLSLATNEQVSQTLCAAISVGSRRSFRLRLAELTGGLVDDNAAVLEVWGGLSLDCSQREKLWTSPSLSSGWQSHCATLAPQQAFDSLTLRASSSSALPSPGRLLVDQIEAVAACP